MSNPLSLEVVSINDIFPHEHIDLRRVNILLKKLSDAAVFTNPLIVMKHEEKYIVLDGATRCTAFKKLNFKHIIVQIISENDDIVLDRWFHAIRKIDKSKLIKLLEDIPEIYITENKSDKIIKNIKRHGWLCYLHTADDKIYYIKSAPDINPLEALNKLTNKYIEASHVSRTTTRNVENVLDKYPDAAGVMVFPKYEITDVIETTKHGKIFPAGITRFLIPGRVMRINTDLNYLKSDVSIEEKNDWLNNTITERYANDTVRYYREPVYLLDE